MTFQFPLKGKKPQNVPNVSRCLSFIGSPMAGWQVVQVSREISGRPANGALHYSFFSIMHLQQQQRAPFGKLLTTARCSLNGRRGRDVLSWWLVKRLLKEADLCWKFIAGLKVWKEIILMIINLLERTQRGWVSAGGFSKN